MEQLIRAPVPTIKTTAQGPLPPWRNEQEEEEYITDPKTFMLERCAAWLGGSRFMFNWIVCAIYWLPRYSILPNGQKWFRSDSELYNAVWEGKVGLCVGKGPQAFKDVPALNLHFDGQNVEIGDWVQWDIHEARLFTTNGVVCRRFKDVQTFSVIQDPNFVY